jgi:hypothetical protein
VPKPNKGLETGVGVVGTLAIFSFSVRGALLLVDWIGRVQTTVQISPYLGKLMSAPAFILELLLGFACLYVALKLERTRELEEAPLIILPYLVPEKPKQQCFWLKVAGSVAGSVVIAALGYGGWLRYKVPSPVAVAGEVQVASAPQLSPAPITPDVPPAKRTSAITPRKHEVTKSAEELKGSIQTKTAAPLIPVPEPSASVSNEGPKGASATPLQPQQGKETTPASRVRITNFVPEGAIRKAFIDGQPIDASSKPEGTAYVVILSKQLDQRKGDSKPRDHSEGS